MFQYKSLIILGTFVHNNKTVYRSYILTYSNISDLMMDREHKRNETTLMHMLTTSSMMFRTMMISSEDSGGKK